MSDTPSLFPEAPVACSPATDRPDPMIWVRRLAIYSHGEAGFNEIRVVEFRRGLNIINTAAPDEELDGPVGHNVGKTLLTRLIRYCLGETHFAREPVWARLQQELPDSYVAAEICIGGVWWVAVRPLGATRPNASKSIQGDSWRLAIDGATEFRSHAAIVQAIEAVTVGSFASTLLPHQGRPVRWFDLLAWLSRDQYCRYRSPLEWRSSFTESGTADLHDEDASVLIRLVMDLLDDSEVTLIQEHKRLLKNRRDTESEVRTLEAELGRTRQFLTGRLKIPDAALTNDLFGSAALSSAKEKKKDTEDLLVKVAEDLELPRLLEEFDAAKIVYAKKERDVESETERGTLLAAQIETHRQSSDSDIRAQLAQLAFPCTLPPGECPLKGDSGMPSSRDEFRKGQIEEKTRELQASEQILAGLADDLKELAATRDATKQRYESAAAKADEQRSSYRRRISQLEALIEEANAYRSENRRLEKALKTLTEVERKIEASRTSHHDAHQQLLSRQQTLNVHLRRVLRVLVSAPSNAMLDISMRGIHISLDHRDATPGEALASETALSLDLACLSASISGLGTVPRFFIHDSPREADLEPHIYARLFRFIKQLEDEAAGAEPNFQYIIATTTPPPKSLAQPPYVRLTLDARNDDGLLLKRRF